MTDVTVDLADLETLVIAAGALKTIEGALQSRRQDPFVIPHLNFTEAHNRLAAEMRNATRAKADTVVPWDEPLTPVEVALLRTAIRFEDEFSQTFTVAPKYRLDHPEVDRLMCKGAIIMGQLCKGILWGGKSDIQWAPDPSGFAVATTARGRRKLEQHAG